jgi:hypothetical protein
MRVGQVATPTNIWSYLTRTLTNPSSASDLANMLTGISGTATGRAAKLDNLDATVSSRATSADIWGYSSRTLTSIKGILERVSPSYNSALTLIYNTKRVVKADTYLELVTDGTNYALASIEDDDLIQTATETIVESGFSTTNLKDRDDSTYTNPANLVGINTEVTHAKWDFGSVAARVIYYKIYTANASCHGRIYASSDDVTYTNVADVSATTATGQTASSFRYLQLRSGNTSTSSSQAATNYQYYTLEVYPEKKTLSFASQASRTIKAFAQGYSQLLERVAV